MRVLACIEAHTITGPGKNLLRFCRLARERGEHQISIATYVRGVEANQFIEAARDTGTQVHLIEERSALDPTVITQLRSLFKREQPAIIQTHAVKSHFLIRFCKPKQTAWIAYHHGYTDPDFKMQVYNRLDHISLPAANRVVTVCHPFADQVRAAGVPPDHIRVIPNSIEVGRPVPMEDAREKWGIPPDARVILTIGRLSNEKGHRFLLQAAAMLPSVLVIVGEGPERQALESQARALGLEQRIVFTGQQRDPAPFYAMADVFALPSLSEGSPNVLLEAMSARIPIVATAVGGVPETVVDGQDALLVPASDPASLAAALQRVLEDGSLAASLRENAYASVVNRFSPDAYYAALTSVYREVASGSQSIL